MAQEDGSKMLATSSEYASVMRHRARKALLNNRVLTSRQRNAIRTADERFDAVQLGVKEMVHVFAGDMKVNHFIPNLDMIAYPVALEVCAVLKAEAHLKE